MAYTWKHHLDLFMLTLDYEGEAKEAPVDYLDNYKSSLVARILKEVPVEEVMKDQYRAKDGTEAQVAKAVEGWLADAKLKVERSTESGNTIWKTDLDKANKMTITLDSR